MSAVVTYNIDKIWNWLKEVYDPEIPVLNIVEMGIVRSVEVQDEQLIIKITPTYSGCPVMAAIEQNIHLEMAEKGIEEVEVKKDFSEPWTTDWMTPEARKKLQEYGIAPPQGATNEGVFLQGLQDTKVVPCPYCHSLDTELKSAFGSTACKALYYCNKCEEPFEHFKCI